MLLNTTRKTIDVVDSQLGNIRAWGQPSDPRCSTAMRTNKLWKKQLLVEEVLLASTSHFRHIECHCRREFG